MFDYGKIITDPNKAKIGQVGWLADSLEYLKMIVDTEEPKALVDVITDRWAYRPFSATPSKNDITYRIYFYPKGE